MTLRRERLWAALVGLLAALTTVAVGDLVSRFVDAAASPLFAVGSWVIDIVPPWVKDTAIALFGTGDKVALLVGLGLLVAILAVAAGILEYHRAPWGVVLLVVVGLVASFAAATRAGATIDWLIPTALGVVLGAFVLRIGSDRLRRWVATDRHGQSAHATGLDRRGFLAALGVSAAVAVVAAGAARMMSGVQQAADAVRQAIALPTAATAAAPIPAGADLGIPGVAALVTPNDEFYRIDTALQVPVIDAAEWRLRITGLVEQEIELTYEELLALPLQESVVTLMCVSNEVGGDLIGNAVWLGYPIRELLARARPTAGADMVLSRSDDGFTASTPLSVLQEEDRDCLLAVGMNGEPLPLEHGFPVRMVVPGLYGYVSATKWVTELRVTNFATDAAYWTQRGWSAEGPVKTHSRIDVPAAGRRVSAGTVAVAGVAWAQHTGVTRVEVRVDGGAWQEARLADAINADTWVQWVYEWEATTGSHTLEVRATDAAGATQRETRLPVIPDGAEGYHTITVAVE